MAYRTVLVGTDGSETAALAVKHAAELAKANDARLVIVTAFSSQNPVEVARAQEDVPEDLRYLLTDSAQADDRAERGKAVAKEVGVKDVRCRVQGGDPAEVLLDVADDVGADLMVVGSKGLSSPSRFLLGNVPNNVSHHAPCDLLIVHTTG